MLGHLVPLGLSHAVVVVEVVEVSKVEEEESEEAKSDKEECDDLVSGSHIRC